MIFPCLSTCALDQGWITFEVQLTNDLQETKFKMCEVEIHINLTLAPVCPRPRCSWPRVNLLLSGSNLAQSISLRGTIVAAALLLLLRPRSIVFSRRECGTVAQKHLPLPPVPPPPDSDAHRPQYCNKSCRCFTLSLESRVITYHQSKLIIADWVGVVNDYGRGRAGAALTPFFRSQ